MSINPMMTRKDLVQRAYQFDEWEVRVAKFFLKTRQRADFYTSLAEMKSQSIKEPDCVVNEWNLQTRSGKVKSNKLTMWLTVLTGGFLSSPVANIDIFLCSLLADMEEGDKLSTALCKWAPEFEQLMLSTQDGLAVDTLRVLAKDAGQIDAYRKKILSESKSIIIAIVMLFGTLWGAGKYFVPTIEKILSADKMTGILAFLVNASNGFQTWQYVIYPLCVIIPFLINYSMSRWVGPQRCIAEMFIPWSIYKRWTGAVFLITLSALITTGRSIPAALAALNANAKPYLSERLEALMAVDDRSLGEALSVIGYEWPDYETIHKISVYMQGDNPEKALIDVANFQAEQISEQIAGLAKRLSTLGMLMSSLIITVFSLSLMTIDPSSMGN